MILVTKGADLPFVTDKSNFQRIMPEGTSVTVAGDLSKPADTLIKKVSNAVGGIFAPYQIKRIANAEAEASLIKAEADIKITDLHRRAMHRFIGEEAQRQKNIEDITAKALPQLNAASDPNKMEDDWVANFFDKSRIVSDTGMQSLWARVLAGEANVPGTYSNRTVNFIAGLDKTDAELFAKFCGFCFCMEGEVIPLIFDYHKKIYADNGLGFNKILHLESIGLIQLELNPAGVFAKRSLPKHVTLHYHEKCLQLKFFKNSGNTLEIGQVLLTHIGDELAPIAGSKPVEGFFEFVSNKWKWRLRKS
jgi:hypothetical protein